MLSLSLKELSYLHFCKTFPLRVYICRAVGKSEIRCGKAEMWGRNGGGGIICICDRVNLKG